MIAAPPIAIGTTPQDFQLIGPETNARTATKRDRRRHIERQLEDHVVHVAHRIPVVDMVAASDFVRLSRFQRILFTGLRRHSFVATLFTGLLLVAVLYLQARNAAVYTGLIGYLLGTLFSAAIFFQSIQNAVHRDAKS